MKKLIAYLIFIFCLHPVQAQDTLPAITVKNISGHIVVSWISQYKDSIANINIQRSYDSLKNYTTIGSVLNAQAAENGYTDPDPPYTKMYYRVFIGFEGGKYIITPPARPVKIIPTSISEDSIRLTPSEFLLVPGIENSKDSSGIKIVTPPPVTHITITPPLPPKPVITYPSSRIFTGRDQNIIIHLPDASNKNYIVKFFDEQDKEIFKLSRLPEEFLIIEKVNFVHSGWFRFELFENGELLEKNKFFIAKDVKSDKHQK